MTNDAAAPASTRAPFAYSRQSLTQTLRTHQFVTMATLAVNWAISIIFTIGLAGGVVQLLKPTEHGGGPGLTMLAMVGLCAAAWLPCCHYLWRCYRSGLRDIRRLHRQIYRLDLLDAEFRRTPRLNRRRASRAAGAVAGSKRQQSAQQMPPADTAGFENVVPFERIRH